MMRTLYFAKINISQIYEVYKEETTIKQIMDKLFICIKDKVEVEKVIERQKDGDAIIETHKFSFSGINRMDNYPSEGLVGSIIKSHQIYIKQINKETGEKKVFPVDNDEVIEFYFSPYDEIVTFYTANKFGYLQICEAFELLINECSKSMYGDLKESFKVSMLTNGVSIDEIKKDLKNFGPIQELSIRIIPPNPMNKTLKHLKENTEKKLKDYQESRITEEISIFKSEYVGGLDTSSEEIENKLDNAIGFHSKITSEEMTGNGYVKVVATSRTGQEYNTDAKQVVKVRAEDSEMIGDVNFASSCRKFVKSIFKK